MIKLVLIFPCKLIQPHYKRAQHLKIAFTMEESNCLALPQAQLAIFKNKANKKPQALLHRD